VKVTSISQSWRIKEEVKDDGQNPQFRENRKSCRTGKAVEHRESESRGRQTEAETRLATEYKKHL
jgi:hypothetical protein